MGGQRSQVGVGGLGWLAPGAAVRYAAVEKDVVIVAAGNIRRAIRVRPEPGV
jgi:hypothetical protein